MILKDSVDYKCTDGRKIAGIGLAMLFLFFAGTTLWWLHLDHSPPAWDDSWYLTNSLVLYDALVTRGLPGFFQEFYTILGFKAPLIAALPAPLYLLFGRDWHWAYLVNIESMLILFAAIYSIAARVANRSAALLAVIIAGTMPLLYGLACWYLVEYTLTAVVAVALWFLLLSRNMEDRRWTCALGAVCGMGLLLKASFPVFVAAPLGIALFHTKRRPQAVLWFLAPCLALALPWYAIHWRATFRNAIDAAYGETTTRAQGTGTIFSLDAIGGYLRMVAQDGVSIYYVALAAALAVALVWRRDRETMQRIVYCFAWIAPFAVFLFAGNKDIRYAAPLYPALSLALAIALDGVFAKRRWISCLVLIAPVVSMLATTVGWPYSGVDHRYARRYDAGVWPHDEIVTLISDRATKTGRLLIGSDRARFNANNFELAVRQQRLPFTVESTAYESDIASLLRAADSASFFLYKEGGEPESPFFNVHYRKVAEYVRNSSSAEEIPLGAQLARLPDGGIAKLFRIKRRASVLSTSLEPLPEPHADFGGLMELTGVSISRTSDAIEVTLGWRCLKPVDREYWCFAHIVDGRNVVVGQLDHRLADGDPPLVAWHPGEGTVETLRHALPGSASKVRLRLGLYHVQSGERLRITLPPQSKATLTDDGTALMIEP